MPSWPVCSSAGTRGQAQRVHVPEQIVAELQSGAAAIMPSTGPQVGARGGLQQLQVVDQRAAEVPRRQLHQMQPFPALHARGVGGITTWSPL